MGKKGKASSNISTVVGGNSPARIHFFSPKVDVEGEKPLRNLKFEFYSESSSTPAEVEEKPIPSFWASAYNGGVMVFNEFETPLVVDLSGMKFLRNDLPVRFQHDAEKGVGHTTELTIHESGWLSIRGVISRDTKYARDVIESAKKGFPWSASIGADVHEMESIGKGEAVEVNGSTHVGPLLVARKTVLVEMSFVDMGADSTARAYVFAQDGGKLNGGILLGGSAMGKKATEMEGGGDSDLSVNPSNEPKPAGPKIEAAASDTNSLAKPPGFDTEGVIRSHREAMAAESDRIASITKVCAAGGGHSDIEAKAIREGWNVDRTELEVLRASRPSAPAVHVGGDDTSTAEVLEAAIAQTGRLEGVDKAYPEKTLEAANKRFRSNIGLQELLLEAAAANGNRFRSFKQDPHAVIRAAFASGGGSIRAGLSSINIGGILSNVANKFLLQGFNSVETAWREICSIRNVTDFKTVTSYRLTGNEVYQQVPAGGELKHGTLGEESFTNKADTYGLLLSVDRRDMINDDLGAITDIPRKLGRGGGLKLNQVIWAEFLNDAAFFSSGNGNLIDDVFDIDGLTVAETTFLEFEDPEGNPLGGMPEILLVPPSLSVQANNVFNSTEIWPATGASSTPMNNPHAGKFRVVMSRYLKNAPLAWYLLGSPNDLPVIEVCFLNGQQSPIIESTDADFNVLGIQFRGYHDFGAAKQDPRGGVKSSGDAT